MGENSVEGEHCAKQELGNAERSEWRRVLGVHKREGASLLKTRLHRKPGKVLWQKVATANHIGADAFQLKGQVLVAAKELTWDIRENKAPHFPVVIGNLGSPKISSCL